MKILQISMGLEFGGIENIELNIAKNINSSFTCDILTPNSGVFDKYKESIPGSIYNLGCNRKNIFSKIKYYIRLNKFLKNNKYDVVHINSSVFLFLYQVSHLCKKYNYIVISHIHSMPKVSKFKKIIINMLMSKYMKNNDLIIGCSKEVINNFCGYSSKTKIIENSIDVNRFKFNNTKRKEIRSKYKLSGRVYAYIGRYSEDKNVDYVLDLFNKINSIDENSHLLLIGELSELKNKVNNKNVLFLGFIDNVNEVLNAVDVCIYPSIREGFGLSILEALTNGVIVYGSNNVIDEFSSYSNFKYFDLDKDISKIIVNDKTKIKREDSYKQFNKYDIKKYIKKIESIYRGEEYED